MAIQVHSGDEIDIFEDSDKWVIDDNERLHVVGQSGNLASYNRGCWTLAARKLDTK